MDPDGASARPIRQAAPLADRPARRANLDQSRPAAIAVLDVGKTNVKLLAIMPEGAILSSRQAPNAVRSGEPYPHCDTEHLWRWMTAALADLGERFAIRAIVPTSYGSTAALVGNAELVLPILDYEADPPGRDRRGHGENWPRFRRSFSRDVGTCPVRGVDLRNEVAEVRKPGAHRNSGTAKEDDVIVIPAVHKFDRNIGAVSYQFRQSAVPPGAGWADGCSGSAQYPTNPRTPAEVIGLAIRAWRFEAVEGDRVVAEQVSYFGRGAAGGQVVEDGDPGGVAVGLLRDRPVAGVHEAVEAEALDHVVEVGAELSAGPAAVIGLGD